MTARPGLAAALVRVGGSRLVARRAARYVAAGRLDEAEALLATALAASPDDPELLRPHALAAHNAGRHTAAFERWERLRAAAPHEAMAWSGMAAMARERHDLDTAQSIIREAVTRFPADRTVLSEAARIAARANRPADALALWRRLVERADAPADWWRGLVHALVLLGRHDEAADALARARYVFAEDAGLLAEAGLLAMSRKDWAGAADLWRLYQERFPDDIVGFDGLGRTRAAADLEQADTGEGTPPQPPPSKLEIAVTPDDDARERLLRFEAIGRDCEFGLVQRRYGAEPISLLRWNTLPPDRLVGALEARFLGLGDPKTTSVRVDEQGLYVVEDSRWGLRLYTFVYADDTPLDSVAARMAKRLGFLRDKFFRDLEEGGKTYVLTAGNIDHGTLARLRDAMRAIGPTCRLLVVTASHDVGAEPPGTVRDQGEGLLLAYLPQLGLADGHWTIAFDVWLEILRKAEPGTP